MESDEPVRQTTEIQTASHGAFFAQGGLIDVLITANRTVIVENGVRLRLNIVDTPGYGDQVNNENWCVECFMVRCGLMMCDSWDPIVKYIKDQHSAYLRKELTAMRDRYIQDTRIHCCLYFISPTGHSLRAIDVIVMKKLSEVVNVVPVIAKADSLTLEEREAFKQKVEHDESRGKSCADREIDSG